MKRTKARRVKQVNLPRPLDEQRLSMVTGGKLDEAPINVVTDYNP